MIDLTVDLGFLRLNNPVITASGTFGYGTKFLPYFELEKLGGFIVKGLYYFPRPGNPPPRLAETVGGLINAIGLQGIGVERFSSEILPSLRDCRTALIINVCGETDEEYARVVEYLDKQEGIAAYEINISCPNVKQAGACPALNPKSTFSIVNLVKKTTKRPVITKLSPNVTDIVEIALSAQEAGSDAVSLVNTFLAMSIDIHTRKPSLANIMGGLSGPAIKPLAVRMVYQVSQALSVPVIGLGGIMNAEDAVEFMLAGASAIQVGTANFIDPRASVKIVQGLYQYCKDNSISHIQELRGALEVS